MTVPPIAITNRVGSRYSAKRVILPLRILKRAMYSLPYGKSVAFMRVALSEMVVEGIKTNIPLHQELLSDDKFVRGGTSIHYLEERLARKGG